jgi:hypothetical protein
MKSPVVDHLPEKSGFGIGSIVRWPTNVLSWMVTSFIIALALAVIVLGFFGTEERGTVLALKTTARWCFFLFWPAYAGSAIARLFGPRFDGLARRGRELGLAFASALLVHLGLIFWLYHIASPRGAMVFFWVGMLCTYLLALFSLPLVRDALGQRIWRIFRTSAVEYIALVFARDFIILPLQTGDGRYPLSYLPFALMLVIGACLRIAALTRHRLDAVATPASR